MPLAVLEMDVWRTPKVNVIFKTKNKRLVQGGHGQVENKCPGALGEDYIKCYQIFEESQNHLHLEAFGRGLPTKVMLLSWIWWTC